MVKPPDEQTGAAATSALPGIEPSMATAAAVPAAADVVREHAASIYKHLKRIFGPSADVDDQLQTVLLEIVRYLPAFEGRARLSTWIFRITLSVAYQELRVRQRIGRREVSLSFDLEDETGSHAPSRAQQHEHHAEGEAEGRAHLRSAQDHVQRAEEAALLYRALDALSAKKRLAVVLHDIEGLTLREISETLSVPLQTVASQVRHGRAELADAMRALVDATRKPATSTPAASSSNGGQR
jgi:RNA polymerase sigma-70 factor (ECF subfamily)